MVLWKMPCARVGKFPLMGTRIRTQATNTWTRTRTRDLLDSDLDSSPAQSLADPGIYFGGAKPRSPIESWGRSPNRGREAPENRGRSPSRGREAPENWGRSPNRGRSPRKKRGEGSGEGARWAPPQKIFEKSILKPCILVHIWGKHLK